MNLKTRFRVRTLFAMLFPVLAAAEAAAQEPAPIQDNSFLIEEAYNQEAGVVQHVSTFARPEGGGSWAYTFTQEWPLGGIRHQLSYTLPVLQGDGLGTGIGDVALNYRYQLAGHPDARLLVAPRATLILPTGSEAKARGTGEVGVQANLPVSYALRPKLMSHANAGVTVGGGDATVHLGGSAIWLVRPAFNVVLEALWLGGDGDEAAFLNPGVRAAFDIAGGVQVVPGLAYTIGVGPSGGDDGMFVYLSFEHAFKRQ